MEKAMELPDGVTPPAKAEIFAWRGANGRRHAVPDMDTDHLFNTICLIWDNAYPDERVRARRPRSFGSDSSPEYLAQALREMFVELLKREDQTNSEQKYILRVMLGKVK